MSYDPVERHRKIEAHVIQKRIGGDLKKYYRFRHDRWYGGVITADCAGCGLICKFCWVRQESILEGDKAVVDAIGVRVIGIVLLVCTVGH